MATAEPSDGSAPRAVEALVADLVRAFSDHVTRALDAKLDGSVTSLAFVDHYLSLARSDEREPILNLLAAGAGAYYGELVRAELGATWIGRGTDPRKLRLLMQTQLIHFSPTDQAFEAIVGSSLDPGDHRLPPGGGLDTSFHLQTASPQTSTASVPPAPPPLQDDASWVEERLAELSPVPEDQFYSLTGRFETLQLILQLLAARQLDAGIPPRTFGVEDYLEIMGGGRHE
jgi:hypothetical protein